MNNCQEVLLAYNNSIRWRWQKISIFYLSSVNRRIGSEGEGGCLNSMFVDDTSDCY